MAILVRGVLKSIGVRRVATGHQPKTDKLHFNGCGGPPKPPSSTKLGIWHVHRQDQVPNTFREIFRSSDGVKMWEKATVDARF